MICSRLKIRSAASISLSVTSDFERVKISLIVELKNYGLL